MRREIAACDSTRPPHLVHDDVLRRFDDLVAASATIKIYVDRTGRVVAADVVSESDDEIGPAVVDALKNEPFRPAECNGRNEAGVYLARIHP